MWFKQSVRFLLYMVIVTLITIVQGQSALQNTSTYSDADLQRLITQKFAKMEEKLLHELEYLKEQSSVVEHIPPECHTKLKEIDLQIGKLNSNLANMQQEISDNQKLIERLMLENKKHKEKLQRLKTKIGTMQQTKGQVSILETDNCTDCIKHGRHERSLTVFAFSTYLSYKINSKASDTVLIFDGIVLNEGNGYSTQTGKYTVSQSGVYVFHFSIEWTNEEIVDVCLMLNGVQMSCAVVNPVGTHGQMSSNTVVLKASRGQRVWIENVYGQGEFYGHPDFRLTTFSGYLLY